MIKNVTFKKFIDTVSQREQDIYTPPSNKSYKRRRYNQMITLSHSSNLNLDDF